MPPLITCHWFLHGQDCGRATYDPLRLVAPRFGPRLWLCWVCGEVWARELVLSPDGSTFEKGYEVWEAPCSMCTSPYSYGLIPGSLTLPTRYPLDTLETLPPVLRKREMSLLLEYKWH